MDPTQNPNQPTPEQPKPGAVEASQAGNELPPGVEIVEPVAAPEVAPPVAATPAPTLPPTPAAAATPAPAPPATPAASSPAVAGPATADDADVIEKDWVDKAAKVVHDTAHDPYKEEEAVEDLQIDYLKKRYGKDIKKSESGQG